MNRQLSFSQKIDCAVEHVRRLRVRDHGISHIGPVRTELPYFSDYSPSDAEENYDWSTHSRPDGYRSLITTGAGGGEKRKINEKATLLQWIDTVEELLNTQSKTDVGIIKANAAIEKSSRRMADDPNIELIKFRVVELENFMKIYTKELSTLKQSLEDTQSEGGPLPFLREIAKEYFNVEKFGTTAKPFSKMEAEAIIAVMNKQNLTATTKLNNNVQNLQKAASNFKENASGDDMDDSLGDISKIIATFATMLSPDGKDRDQVEADLQIRLKAISDLKTGLYPNKPFPSPSKWNPEMQKDAEYLYENKKDGIAKLRLIIPRERISALVTYFKSPVGEHSATYIQSYKKSPGLYMYVSEMCALTKIDQLKTAVHKFNQSSYRSVENERTNSAYSKQMADLRSFIDQMEHFEALPDEVTQHIQYGINILVLTNSTDMFGMEPDDTSTNDGVKKYLFDFKQPKGPQQKPRVKSGVPGNGQEIKIQEKAGNGIRTVEEMD